MSPPLDLYSSDLSGLPLARTGQAFQNLPGGSLLFISFNRNIFHIFSKNDDAKPTTAPVVETQRMSASSSATPAPRTAMDETSKAGEFKRTASVFRNWIRAAAPTDG